MSQLAQVTHQCIEALQSASRGRERDPEKYKGQICGSNYHSCSTQTTTENTTSTYRLQFPNSLSGGLQHSPCLMLRVGRSCSAIEPQGREATVHRTSQTSGRGFLLPTCSTGHSPVLIVPLAAVCARAHLPMITGDSERGPLPSLPGGDNDDDYELVDTLDWRLRIRHLPSPKPVSNQAAATIVD